MDVSSWTCEDVADWLGENGFEQYRDTFCKQHKIDGKALLSITEEDLRVPPLEIKVLGDIKHLCTCINSLQGKTKQNSNAQNRGVANKAPSLRARGQNLSPSSGRALLEKLQQDDTELDEEEIQNAETILENMKKRKSHSLDAEFHKTVLSFVYAYAVFLFTSFIMVIVHDRVPDMDKYPPLPDIFLDNVPFIPWAFAAAEMIGVFLMTIWIVVLFFHKHRFILLRRMFSLLGTLFLLRSVCMLITSLSVPGKHLKCQGRLYPDFHSKMRRTFEIWTGLGMSISGVRTCGDYMFSGHTCCITCFNFFITEYTPRHLPFVHTTTWIANMFGLFFILAAHEHYSLDVFVAFYLTSRLFLYYHTLANTRFMLSKEKKRTRIWFPLFTFFESKCDGRVPNEYEWPLPSISRVRSWIKGDSTKKIK